MKLYLEEKVHLLCDAYSTTKEVDTSYKTAHLETLQMKNKAKCRITEKIPLHSTDTMLQICHSEEQCQLIVQRLYQRAFVWRVLSM